MRYPQAHGGLHGRILMRMQAAEIELKFPVDDVSGFRARVGELGFWLETERTFEGNTLYDTPDRSLRARKQILRLRSYGKRCVLTHKRKAEMGDAGSRYKTRIETESEVEDCAAMAEVFHQMGYEPVFRYEKFRTEWGSEGGGHLVLDETPIGVWAELEGAPEWIDVMVERLGVGPDDCLTDSYGTLFLDWKAKTGAAAENMTFAEVEAAATASV
jgi:adenylate cyclase, class 2